MQNSKLGRSLKKGCNDYIEEIAIIQDKLVTSTVKQKSNKRPNTTLATDKSKKIRQTVEETTKKGQTEKEREDFFNKMLKEEIVQDTIDADKEGYEKYKKRMEDIRLDAAENNRNRMIKLADKKGAINKKKKESDAREVAIENRRIKKKLLIKLEHQQYTRRKK